RDSPRNSPGRISRVVRPGLETRLNLSRRARRRKWPAPDLASVEAGGPTIRAAIRLNPSRLNFQTTAISPVTKARARPGPVSARPASTIRRSLNLVKLGVLAMLRQELVVRAHLDDAGAVEHDDEIGHPHSAKTMGHEDRDAAGSAVGPRPPRRGSVA